jgi:enoyl-CoA hydratase/carnithine racemase
VSSVILTSAFPKVFSAGLDLKTLIRAEESESEFASRIHDYIGLFQQTASDLLSCPAPTAAVISGACPAGGLFCLFAVMFESWQQIPSFLWD